MNEDAMERKLRETLTAVAATTEVGDRWTEISAVPVPARHQHGPLLVAAAAFAVVLVTVGSFALVSTLIGDGRDVVSPPADPTDTTGPSTLRYPVPGYIPDDVSDVWAQIPVRAPGWPSVVTAVVGRRVSLDGEGFPTDIEAITAVHVRRSMPEDATEDGEIIELDAGRSVRLTEGVLPGSVAVTWTEGGVTVVVSVADGDVDRALDVAAGVTWTGDDPTTPGSVVVDPPPGLDLIAEPVVVSGAPGPMVSMQWDDPVSRATVPGAQPPVVDVLQVDVTVSKDSPAILLAGHPLAESFELRGHPAYLWWRREYAGVVWEEAPGVSVAVSGWYADLTEIIKIAEGLEFTDETSWHAYFDVFDPAGVPPTTRVG